MMIALAGWMNRQQQDVIEFLRTENQVLREALGHKPKLNDNQHRLAAAAVRLRDHAAEASNAMFGPVEPLIEG